jgi:agmatine deiminase
MITDSETNLLYLANSLRKEKYSAFLDRFEKVLKKYSINYDFLPNTKDIWAKDYMPIQISIDKFVQFTYNPDYLQTAIFRQTISPVDSICKSISLTAYKSDIVVDGGNVIRSQDKVVMCDKVFAENKNIKEKDLIQKLADTLEVNKIIFVPWDSNDFTGHADGMVRFVDNDTVFINDYSKEKSFQKKILKALNSEKLDSVSIPYNPYSNKTADQANGVYINFLQMKDIVFVPTFGKPEDSIALRQFEKYFKTVVPVDSNEIADEGGILNCISWNIRTDKK